MNSQIVLGGWEFSRCTQISVPIYTGAINPELIRITLAFVEAHPDSQLEDPTQFSIGRAIEDAIRQAQSGGRKVFIAGLALDVENNLARLGVLELLTRERVHPTRVAALETARDSLTQSSTDQ